MAGAKGWWMEGQETGEMNHSSLDFSIVNKIQPQQFVNESCKSTPGYLLGHIT